MIVLQVVGVPFSVAYCPLCNTAYVFSRKLNFKDKNYKLKFGTSGIIEYKVEKIEDTNNYKDNVISITINLNN